MKLALFYLLIEYHNSIHVVRCSCMQTIWYLYIISFYSIFTVSVLLDADRITTGITNSWESLFIVKMNSSPVIPFIIWSTITISYYSFDLIHYSYRNWSSFLFCILQHHQSFFPWGCNITIHHQSLQHHSMPFLQTIIEYCIVFSIAIESSMHRTLKIFSFAAFFLWINNLSKNMHILYTTPNCLKFHFLYW